MSFLYDEAAKELFQGHIELDAATIKVLLVDADTTADTERTAANLGAFTDLSEADGAGYARQTLANQAVAFDAGTKKVSLTADATTFTIGANTSTEQNVAALVYVDRGGAGSDLPLLFIDDGGFPVTPVGQTFEITWSADGLLSGEIIAS